MDIVYQITDTLTNLKYVGSKKNWAGPGTYFGSPNCKSKRFKKYVMQLAWKEALIIRKDTFQFDIFESYENVTHEFLLERELFWQKKFDVVKSMEFINAGFAKKGFCGDIFAQLTPEEANILKMKISLSEKIRMSSMSEEERKKKHGRSGEKNGNYGNKWNDEQRRLASERKKEYCRTHKNLRLGKTNIEIFGEEKAAEISNSLSQMASKRIGEKNSFFGKKHSEHTKNLIRIKNRGRKPTNTKKIKINDQIFDGLTEASKATGIKATTIWHRIRSKNIKFKDYIYLN